MKVKTLELFEGEAVESWEDRGPARADVLDDVTRANIEGIVAAVKLA